jgi:hypothetical protein
MFTRSINQIAQIVYNDKSESGIYSNRYGRDEQMYYLYTKEDKCPENKQAIKMMYSQSATSKTLCRRWKKFRLMTLTIITTKVITIIHRSSSNSNNNFIQNSWHIKTAADRRRRRKYKSKVKYLCRKDLCMKNIVIQERRVSRR